MNDEDKTAKRLIFEELMEAFEYFDEWEIFTELREMTLDDNVEFGDFTEFVGDKFKTEDDYITNLIEYYRYLYKDQ